MPVVIRNVEESDARAIIDLQTLFALESSFMLMEPGERNVTLADQKKRIRDILSSRESTLIVAELAVAESDSVLVGLIVGHGGNARRNRFTMSLAVGVVSSHWGQGIGRQLMHALEDYARSISIRRLELTVIKENNAAKKLYQHCGFQTEGIKRSSLFVNNQFVDEHLMGKLL